MYEDARDVDEAAVEAIRAILARNLGESIAKAVDFYFDTRIAVTNPEAYTRMLEKTFRGGAEHLVRTITSELCTGFGLEPAEGMTLAECLRSIRCSVRVLDSQPPSA